MNTKETKEPKLCNPNLDDLTILPEFIEPCRELSIENFRNDIDIFTEFGDLTPMQVLTVFDQFINWPDYKESSFNTSLEAMLMKLHSNPDESVDGVDLPEQDDDSDLPEKDDDIEEAKESETT